MKNDITRNTFDAVKHFSRVLMQQGRVTLDADWNEQSDITAHRTETEARDVIGPCGAPKHNPGFKISSGSGGDFTIGAGRFYVDGILCENEEPVAFTKQSDLPGTTSIQDSGSYLVYLHVWQRHLTALDDAEIREVALGGADTATRTKTIWQVKTLRIGDVGTAVTCADDLQAWNELIAPSTGQFSARAKPDEESDKPCIVPSGAGYRRLENQLYRVEIHNAGELGGGGSAPTFKWSRDNASIVAAVQSIANDKITLTTARQDTALEFGPGQWIEITDDRHDLLALPGTMTRITKVEDLVLTVDTANAIPPGALNDVDLTLHAKVRRWDSPGLTNVSVPAGNDHFLPLEDGVEVKFENGVYRTADHCMIPARTNTGNVEWPRDTALPPNPIPQSPHGVIHHFCRLAIIELSDGNVTVMEDCRPQFPPLTELDRSCGCCTNTVGPTEAADFRSIQQAIDSLPGNGGHVCVLAGEYKENIQIVNRRNITISGCGERTRISSRAVVEEKSGESVIRITNSLNICIETLSLIADKLGNGVLVEGNVPIGERSRRELEIRRAGPTQNIRLTQLAITAALRSAIELHDTDHVTICHCTIRMTDLDGAAPGIFFQGEDALIERNTITPAPIKDEQLRGAFQRASYGVSGIQIGGGSRLVRVLENLITNVTGQGITLGSLEETDDVNTPPIRIVGRPTRPGDPCDKCAEPGTRIKFRFRDPRGREKQLRSPDPLEQIYLEQNRIRQTGLDGIGVIGFFDLREVDEFVSVRGLTICGNEIRGCLRRAPANIESAMAARMGYGGIALADVTELVIHDNVIEHTGLVHAQPVCGVFVAHGEGIDISRNRILHNGGQQNEKVNGPRGGVYIASAVAPVAARASIPEATGFPALKVHDNIIGAPLGRALTLVALGPVSVVGNQLTSSGVVAQERPTLFAPATVFIFDLGLSNEFYLQARSFAAVHAQKVPAATITAQSSPQTRLADGNVLFVNNQCSLDLLESGKSGAYASITILSLDDVAFQDNQCDCNLMLGQDFILTQAFLFAMSLRVTGNRFKEGFFNAPLSAMTLGLLNTTAHNQATHCLMVLAPPAWLIKEPNTIVITAFFKDLCTGSLPVILGNFVALMRKT